MSSLTVMAEFENKSKVSRHAYVKDKSSKIPWDPTTALIPSLPLLKQDHLFRLNDHIVQNHSCFYDVAHLWNFPELPSNKHNLKQLVENDKDAFHAIFKRLQHICWRHVTFRWWDSSKTSQTSFKMDITHQSCSSTMWMFFFDFYNEEKLQGIFPLELEERENQTREYWDRWILQTSN